MQSEFFSTDVRFAAVTSISTGEHAKHENVGLDPPGIVEASEIGDVTLDCKPFRFWSVLIQTWWSPGDS